MPEILTYFSQYVEQRYPNIPVRIRIEQDGNTVILNIDTPDGRQIDTIRQSLEEYALIMTGRANPGDYLINPLHIIEIKFEIKSLNMKIEFLQEQMKMKDNIISYANSEVSRMSGLLNKQLELSDSLNRTLVMGLTGANDLTHTIRELARKNPDVQSSLDRLFDLVERGLVPADEDEVKPHIAFIAQKSPSTLNEIFNVVKNALAGTAGNLLAAWIQAGLPRT